jgi:hypothetical protein
MAELPKEKSFGVFGLLYFMGKGDEKSAHPLMTKNERNSERRVSC